MNPFAVALKITPVFSINLFKVLIIVSLASLIVVISLPLNLFTKLIGFLIILIWLVVVLREHCWHQDRAIITAILRTDDTWLVFFNGKESVKAELLSGCLVQPWLTVLQFRLPDRRRKSLILLQDNVDKDIFRRLRVRLKNQI